MKIAIVHDWLVTYAGAERVLEQMLICYPESDLFSIVDFLPENQRSFLAGKSVVTSFIQKLPGAKAHYRAYLPLMPLAVEQFDLSGYDIVVSSSHAVAKGAIVGPDQLHICMCYSPIRYAWDMQHQYLRESGLESGIKGWLARLILHYIRLWDCRTANGVDCFVAISHFIARRIEKAYRRNAVVIYPPVDVEGFLCKQNKDDFYLTASRMVPYKKLPLIVEAFSKMQDKKLVVIGDGPEFEKCGSVAGPNVQLLGYQSFENLRNYMQSARAFVFAAEEDFGIAPLEAQACGTPVIAYGKGAVLETIVGLDHDEPTGVFFDEQTVISITKAVELFEKNCTKFIPEKCRENVARFSTARFREEFSHIVNLEFEKFRIGKSVKLGIYKTDI